MKHFLNKKITNNSTKGFTLVEFIVIMSIFAIMVGVVLFNFAGFRSTVTMENLAHDIALSIRQIQVSSGATQSFTPDDEIPRGIMFASAVNGFDNQFVLFQDNNESGLYEENEDLLLDQVMIQTKDFISDISYSESSSSCDDDTTPISSDVSILFQRYNTVALFNSEQSNINNVSCIKITIQSGDSDKTREVIISRIGQVSVR